MDQRIIFVFVCVSAGQVTSRVSFIFPGTVVVVAVEVAVVLVVVV